MDISQYVPVLISFVMSKLPEDIKLQISRSMPVSRVWDVDEPLAALLREIESREICYFMNYSRKDNKYRGSPVNLIIVQVQLFSVVVINSVFSRIRTEYGEIRNTQNNSNDLNDGNGNAENSVQNVSSSSVNFCNAEKNIILIQTAEALINSSNNCEEKTFYLTLERNLLLLMKTFLKN